jgi:hypothetical protein
VALPLARIPSDPHPLYASSELASLQMLSQSNPRDLPEGITAKTRMKNGVAVPVVTEDGTPVYRVRVWDAVLKKQIERTAGGRGTESLVGTAPAAPPPPTNAMRAGPGGGVPTGDVAATRARHGFGTVVLGDHSGCELGVVQVPRNGRTGRKHGGV